MTTIVFLRWWVVTVGTSVLITCTGTLPLHRHSLDAFYVIWLFNSFIQLWKWREVFMEQADHIARSYQILKLAQQESARWYNDATYIMHSEEIITGCMLFYCQQCSANIFMQIRCLLFVIVAHFYTDNTISSAILNVLCMWPNIIPFSI